MDKEINDLENKLNQVNTQLTSHNQRLDDVQEVNFSFKYYPSTKEAVRQGTIVKFDTSVCGTGVDSTGLFTAPIGNFKKQWIEFIQHSIILRSFGNVRILSDSLRVTH